MNRVHEIIGYGFDGCEGCPYLHRYTVEHPVDSQSYPVYRERMKECRVEDEMECKKIKEETK